LPQETGRSHEKDLVQEVYVGRQPILDKSLAVFGYELLFRHGPTAAYAGEDGDRATSRVIVNTFAEFGLESLVGSTLAFVNLTRHFIVGALPLPFGPEHVVLEILETTMVDDEVLAGLHTLIASGYKLAIDDYRADDYARTKLLLPLADYVKVDILDQDDDELAACVEQCRPHPARLIAERVETRETMDRCLQLGFDLFQGYLLGRPTVLSTPSLSPSSIACMELLTRLTKPGVRFSDLEEIVRLDVALSYRVLRAVNAAAPGLVRPIASVREALVLLGHRQLRAWVLLSVLADANEVVEEQLIAAMTRARMCELLAPRVPGLNVDSTFLAGLLSTLDFLLGLPMTEVVKRLPLDESIRLALVDHAGSLGRLLDTVSAYEAADLEALSTSSIDFADLASAYLTAVGWSIDMVKTAVDV
jgi:c-di-GMP-related signal transduction protein